MAVSTLWQWPETALRRSTCRQLSSLDVSSFRRLEEQAVRTQVDRREGSRSLTGSLVHCKEIPFPACKHSRGGNKQIQVCKGNYIRLWPFLPCLQLPGQFWVTIRENKTKPKCQEMLPSQGNHDQQPLRRQTSVPEANSPLPESAMVKRLSSGASLPGSKYSFKVHVDLNWVPLLGPQGVNQNGVTQWKFHLTKPKWLFIWSSKKEYPRAVLARISLSALTFTEKANLEPPNQCTVFFSLFLFSSVFSHL